MPIRSSGTQIPRIYGIWLCAVSRLDHLLQRGLSLWLRALAASSLVDREYFEVEYPRTYPQLSVYLRAIPWTSLEVFSAEAVSPQSLMGGGHN